MYSKYRANGCLNCAVMQVVMFDQHPASANINLVSTNVQARDNFSHISSISIHTHVTLQTILKVLILYTERTCRNIVLLSVCHAEDDVYCMFDTGDFASYVKYQY